MFALFEDPEGKTAEELSEKAQEVEFAAFLAACKAGEVPAKAPAAKVNFFHSQNDIFLKMK